MTQLRQRNTETSRELSISIGLQCPRRFPNVLLDFVKCFMNSVRRVLNETGEVRLWWNCEKCVESERLCDESRAEKLTLFNSSLSEK